MALLDVPMSEVAMNQTPVERRRSPREPRKTSGWISAATGTKTGNGFNVVIRDLSLHGVGLIS
ncbi:MAG TPA: hypothetical protein VGB55_10105, partial [Tepidisphaeraceae bacterium]